MFPTNRRIRIPCRGGHWPPAVIFGRFSPFRGAGKTIGVSAQMSLLREFPFPFPRFRGIMEENAVQKGRFPMNKQDLMETTLSTEPIFDGRIFSVRKDVVALPDGQESTREVVHHKSGGACVVPLTADGMVYIVRQCRYPYADVLLEIPAGKLDPGEAPEQCAARELKEECGVTAGKLTSLGTLYPTPAYVDEVIHMFLAEELSPAVQHLDDGEFLEVEKLPLETLVEQVLSGEVKDSKTQAALLKTWILKGRK